MLSAIRPRSVGVTPTADVSPSSAATTNLAHAPAVAFALVLALLLAVLAWPGAAAAEASSGIVGTVFQDLDRDGVLDPGEPGFGGHRLDLFDAQGQFVRWVDTDAQGRYALPDVAPGTYELRTRSSTWREMRDGWVPTTTGSLLPQQSVEVGSGVVTSDLGWRPIVTSSDVSAPISRAIGPEGLRVEVYNDVVDAGDLYDHIAGEFRLGAEAPHTTVRFGYSTTSMANASIVGSDGDYRSVTIVIWVSYRSWLDQGDRTLAHEYGHAFGEYHTTMVQQDRTWSAYLQARGLADDERVGTSYAWMPTEIIAEDYRQLFASDNAARAGQINTQIPMAEDIPGLREWLATTFVGTDAPVQEPTDPAPTDPAPTDPAVTPEDPAFEPAPDDTVSDPAVEPAPDDTSSDGQKCHPRRGCDGPADSPQEDTTTDTTKKCHPVRGC